MVCCTVDVINAHLSIFRESFEPNLMNKAIHCEEDAAHDGGELFASPERVTPHTCVALASPFRHFRPVSRQPPVDNSSLLEADRRLVQIAKYNSLLLAMRRTGDPFLFVHVRHSSPTASCMMCAFWFANIRYPAHQCHHAYQYYLWVLGVSRIVDVDGMCKQLDPFPRSLLHTPVH